MKKYKIGTASRQAGVSPQTLRYYEKENLITSYKDETGSTRYYGSKHFKQLFNIRRYYKLGFSENDVRRLLDSESLTEMEAAFAARQADAFAELELARQRVHALQAQMDDFALIRKLLGQVEVCENPPLSFLITRDATGNLLESPEIAEVHARWIKSAHRLRMAGVIPEAVFLSDPDGFSRHYGYCVETAALTDMGTGAGDHCILHMQPRRCLHTVCALTGNHLSFRSLLPQVYAFLRETGMQVAGDPFGRCLAVVGESHNWKQKRLPRAAYYEYWIPVR